MVKGRIMKNWLLIILGLIIFILGFMYIRKAGAMNDDLPENLQELKSKILNAQKIEDIDVEQDILSKAADINLLILHNSEGVREIFKFLLQKDIPGDYQRLNAFFGAAILANTNPSLKKYAREQFKAAALENVDSAIKYLQDQPGQIKEVLLAELKELEALEKGKHKNVGHVADALYEVSRA